MKIYNQNCCLNINENRNKTVFTSNQRDNLCQLISASTTTSMQEESQENQQQKQQCFVNNHDCSSSLRRATGEALTRASEHLRRVATPPEFLCSRHFNFYNAAWTNRCALHNCGQEGQLTQTPSNLATKFNLGVHSFIHVRCKLELIEKLNQQATSTSTAIKSATTPPTIPQQITSTPTELPNSVPIVASPASSRSASTLTSSETPLQTPMVTHNLPLTPQETYLALQHVRNLLQLHASTRRQTEIISRLLQGPKSFSALSIPTGFASLEDFTSFVSKKVETIMREEEALIQDLVSQITTQHALTQDAHSQLQQLETKLQDLVDHNMTLKQNRSRKRRQRRLRKKKEAKKKKSDSSASESISSADEALHWLLSNNYSFTDYRKWSQFASGRLPFSRRKLEQAQQKWREKSRVKERIKTRKHEKMTVVYLDFLEELKEAISSRIEELPQGKIRVCIKGDGRVHHGDCSLILVFSLPDVTNPHSNVSSF